MTRHLTDAFYVWSGGPRDVFPVGEVVVAAEPAKVRELAAALRVDFGEVHDVPFAELADSSPRPFRLRGLRAFVARHRPAFDEMVDRARVVANALTHAEARIDSLRAIGAPKVVLDNAVRERAAIAAPGFAPLVDMDALVPDVLGAASLVDIDARTESGEPLVVDADITDLVLVAVQSAVGASAVAASMRRDVGEWTSMLDDAREGEPPPGVIRVRPTVYRDRLVALEHASDGAWLRIVCAEPD